MLNVFYDHIKDYPFNLHYCNFSAILIKLNNNSILLSDDNIISDKPIFLSYDNFNLLIWDTTPITDINNVNFRDLHIYKDFNGNEIKAWPIYDFKYWLIPKTSKLNQILLIGDNNKIEINNIKVSDIVIEGNNNSVTQSNEIESLSDKTTYT